MHSNLIRQYNPSSENYPDHSYRYCFLLLLFENYNFYDYYFAVVVIIIIYSYYYHDSSELSVIWLLYAVINVFKSYTRLESKTKSLQVQLSVIVQD
jgi:hypothetical protein